MADYSGVDAEQVIIGGDGADEIIEVLGKTFMDPGCEFVVPMPSYMYYEYTLQSHDARPAYAVWNVEENRLELDSVLESSVTPPALYSCAPPTTPPVD